MWPFFFIYESQREQVIPRTLTLKELNLSFLCDKNVIMISKSEFADFPTGSEVCFTDGSGHDKFRSSDSLERKSRSSSLWRRGWSYMRVISDGSGRNRVRWRLGGGGVFCILLMSLTVLITCSAGLMSWVWWVHKHVPVAVIAGVRLEAHPKSTQSSLFNTGGGYLRGQRGFKGKCATRIFKLSRTLQWKLMN